MGLWHLSAPQGPRALGRLGLWPPGSQAGTGASCFSVGPSPARAPRPLDQAHKGAHVTARTFLACSAFSLKEKTFILCNVTF